MLSYIFRYLVYRFVARIVWRVLAVAAVASPFMWSTIQGKFHEVLPQVHAIATKFL